MRIILAGPRGFCAGVNMAIESLRLAIERFGTPVYVYHEIVHNTWVVDDFRRMGAIFVDDLEEVPRGANLLYSAHGVSPEVRHLAAQRQLNVIDATCPLVTKVHREAAGYAKKGYTIVLIGHANHDEVIGVTGEAPQSTVLVQTAEDVERLEVQDMEKLAYLTQTTLSIDEATRIIDRLKQKFPKIVGRSKDDVCYATSNRQEAVRMLSREADLMLVVGSANSSNSRRLAELASAEGVVAHLVDGPANIDQDWFNGEETVVITAGASAPETIVQQCVELLVERFNAKVESRMSRPEKVKFSLPKPLR